MNILYLIGNGFDINIGLKTSYKDFYKYYKRLPSDSDNIKKLKDCISPEDDLWSNLELALGKYCSTLYDDANDFIEALIDISTQLREYISQENDKIEVTPSAVNKLNEDLSSPNKYMTPAQQQKFAHYRQFGGPWNGQWNVNIITFNYTFSFEKLLDGYSNRRIGTHNNTYSVILKNLYHIHGDLDNTMLIGVNSVEQIAKEEFRENKMLVDMFVKPQANIMSESLIDETCMKLITEANLICLFGLSLGPTDEMWWEAIRQNLQRQKCRVIIFEYKPNIDLKRQAYWINAYKQNIKENLIKTSDEQIIDRINVEFNQPIFNIGKCVKQI